MSEETQQGGGCMKVVSVVCFVLVLCLAVSAGAVMWTWDTWGSKQWAKFTGEGEEVEEKPEAIIRELPRRPVVATSPQQANPQLYDSYVNRKDVLVLVEYYSDT